MSKPIKKLNLQRETVKSLSVKAQIRTGLQIIDTDRMHIIGAGVGAGGKVDTAAQSFVGGGGRPSGGPRGTDTPDMLGGGAAQRGY